MNPNISSWDLAAFESFTGCTAPQLRRSAARRSHGAAAQAPGGADAEAERRGEGLGGAVSWEAERPVG